MLLFSFILFTAVFGNLHFGKDGKFKILQVADIHFQKGAESECKDITPSPYPCSGLNSTEFYKKVIDEEKPDFVVFTGDQIDWGCEDAEWCMDQVFEGVITKKVQWAGVLGNHDFQAEDQKYGAKKIIEYMSKLPYSLTEDGPDDVHGHGNYKLEIYKDDSSSETPVFDLFFLDSGGSQKPINYDFIRKSQIDWFDQNSHKDMPNLIFFHIPLVETRSIIDFKIPIVGDEFDIPEYYWSSLLNAGAFLSFWEKGNVQGIINGHCHITDFCGNLLGVNICFGGATDYDVYGKEGWPRRTRIIQIENYGKIGYTWKRLDNPEMTKKDYQTLWNISEDFSSKQMF